MKKDLRKAHRARRAILVLESPWELDERDANRSSVVPFVEGIAKYAGDTEVYHANFYDEETFKRAFDVLRRCGADNALVYIAAHGAKGEIAGADISDLIFEVGYHARESNITGLMIGSCYVGEDTQMMEIFMEGTGLRWCAGYGSSCNWLAGTLIDCAIMAQMLELDAEDLSDRDLMVESLGNALSPFSTSYAIGTDQDDNHVSLADSINFVVQPTGRGQRAKDVKFEVLAEYELEQLYEYDEDDEEGDDD